MTLKDKRQFFHVNDKIRIKNSIRKEEKKWKQTTFCVQVKNYIHVVGIYMSYTTSSPFQIILKVRLLPEVPRKKTQTTKYENQDFRVVGYFIFVFLLN